VLSRKQEEIYLAAYRPCLCNAYIAPRIGHRRLRLCQPRGTSIRRHLWEEQSRRLRARTLFADDYYQTLLFYPRQEAAGKVETLLGEKPKQWMVLLYARGGVGKTMFLRWLVARDLVEKRHTPVAYLDLDDLRVDVAARYPWLLLLPMLQQWKEQSCKRAWKVCWELPAVPPAPDATGRRRQKRESLATDGSFGEGVGKPGAIHAHVVAGEPEELLRSIENSRCRSRRYR
jgi:hypothetical protein